MDTVLIIGRSHPALGSKLAAALGVEAVRCLIKEFPDGEIRIEVKQDMVDRDACVLQTTAAPTGRNLLELLLLADACRRRGARSITAIIPYFAYARQDRRISGEEPIGARLMTDLLATRCDRIIAVDLHNAAIEGFASVPLVHLSAVPLLAEAFRKHRTDRQVLVAPDAGAVKLVQAYARMLKLPVAFVEKERQSATEVAVRAVTGDVKERAVVLVDDMISTGGTMIAAAEALLEGGASRDISIITSHCLLVGSAAAGLARLPVKRIITTDSVVLQKAAELPLEVCTLAGLLADTLREMS